MFHIDCLNNLLRSMHQKIFLISYVRFIPKKGTFILPKYCVKSFKKKFLGL